MKFDLDKKPVEVKEMTAMIGGSRTPTLHLDIDKDNEKLLEDLKSNGTANISYKVVGFRKSDDEENTCIDLKILSIEPQSSSKNRDSKVNVSSDEALDRYIKSSKQ